MSADNPDFFIMKPTQTVKYYGYAFNIRNLEDYVYEVVHKDDPTNKEGTEIKKENWKSIQENLIVRDSNGVNVRSSDIDWTNTVLFVFKAERSSGAGLTDKQIVLVDNDTFLPSEVKEEQKEEEEDVQKPTFVVYKHDPDKYAVNLMLPSNFDIGNIAVIQFAFSDSLDSNTKLSTIDKFVLPRKKVNEGGAAIRIDSDDSIENDDVILYIHTKDIKDKLVINRNPFKTRIWMKKPKKSWEEDIKIIHRNT